MQIPIPIRRVGKTLSSNSPTILSGLAVAGVVATAVLAIRATPKAERAVKEAEARKNTWTEAGVDQYRAEFPEGEAPSLLTPVETIKATWTIYIPATVTGLATIACIVGSNQIGMRRNIALAGAYTLVDGAFRQYKDEVIEQLGAVKARKVDDAVLVKKMEANPPKEDSQVIMIGGSDVLCFESLSGRYFRSTAEDIRRAENDFNQDLLSNRMYSDLNLWYDYIGLEPTLMGGVLGWSVDRKLDLHFTSHLTPEGSPCLAIGYKHYPFEDFSKL
jgi:hypothetical protein